MTDDIIAIAKALRDAIESNVPEVQGRATIGRNTIRQTPALQVIPGRGDIRSEAAGGGLYLNAASLEVVFYQLYRPNLVTDEEELGKLLNKTLRLFKNPDDPGSTIDTTLGGLVEVVRPTGYEFGEIPQNRNGNAYKVVAIYVSAGEPLGISGF